MRCAVLCIPFTLNCPCPQILVEAVHNQHPFSPFLSTLVRNRASITLIVVLPTIRFEPPQPSSPPPSVFFITMIILPSFWNEIEMYKKGSTEGGARCPEVRGVSLQKKQLIKKVDETELELINYLSVELEGDPHPHPAPPPVLFLLQ